MSRDPAANLPRVPLLRSFCRSGAQARDRSARAGKNQFPPDLQTTLYFNEPTEFIIARSPSPPLVALLNLTFHPTHVLCIHGLCENCS